jgi:hypothetical protein
MVETIEKILGSPVGSFSFVLGIMILVGWVIYYVTKFTTKITTDHGILAKRVDKIESNTDKIKEELIVIRASLLSGVPVREIQSQSPISLTTAGLDTAKELDIDARIANNWGKIVSYIDSNVKDKNAYDIQQFCVEKATVNLSNFLSENDIREIKLIAYNKGRAIETFGGVIGITVRDAYFRHKGIAVEDVDKTNPNKT